PTHASVLQGVLNLPEGIAQGLGFNLPGPLEAVRKEAAKAPMPELGEFAGGVPAPWNLVAPREAQVPIVGRSATSGARGAVGSLFTPQESPETFWKGAKGRAGLGGVLGSLFGVLGGPVSRDAQHLLDNDIRVTPGALAGRTGKVGERLAGFVPGASQ